MHSTVSIKNICCIFALTLLCGLLAFGQGIGGKAGIGGQAGIGGGLPAWTFSQVACSTQTGCPAAAMACTSSPCVATFSSALSAGDSIIINEGDTGATVTGVTVGSDTVVGPVSNCTVTDANIGVTAHCWYVLSAAGGETSVSVAATFSGGFIAYVATVAHKSGTPTFDVANSIDITTNCTSCVGAALTLTGGSDFISRFGIEENGGTTAISGGYTLANPLTTDFDRLTAYLVNATSGAAPTWTVSVTGHFIDSAMAIQ